MDAVVHVNLGSDKARRLAFRNGAANVPPPFRDGLANDVAHVTDLDRVVGCRLPEKKEEILWAVLSGGAYSAVRQHRPRIPDDATCVINFPDRGERDLDTIYSDEWVAKPFGEVEHFGEETGEAEICKTMIYWF